MHFGLVLLAIKSSVRFQCPTGDYNRSGSQQLPRELANRLLRSWQEELAAQGHLISGKTETLNTRLLTHEDGAWIKPARCLAPPYITSMPDHADTIAQAGQLNEQSFAWQLTKEYRELVKAPAHPFSHISHPPDVGVWSDSSLVEGAKCNGTEEWVSDDYRFIFRNMPKAGTNSLIHYFTCNFGMQRVPCQHIPTWKKRQYLHISSVRNPIDRFISGYNEIRLVHAAHFPSTLDRCAAPYPPVASPAPAASAASASALQAVTADWDSLRSAMRKKTGTEKWIHGWWGVAGESGCWHEMSYLLNHTTFFAMTNGQPGPSHERAHEREVFR
jgi:hypothetical protein